MAMRSSSCVPGSAEVARQRVVVVVWTGAVRWGEGALPAAGGGVFGARWRCLGWPQGAAGAKDTRTKRTMSRAAAGNSQLRRVQRRRGEWLAAAEGAGSGSTG